MHCSYSVVMVTCLHDWQEHLRGFLEGSFKEFRVLLCSSLLYFSNLPQDSGEMFPITEENMKLPLGKSLARRLKYFCRMAVKGDDRLEQSLLFQFFSRVTRKKSWQEESSLLPRFRSFMCKELTWFICELIQEWFFLWEISTTKFPIASIPLLLW